MLAYSKTAGFRHDGAIAAANVMLQEVAAEQGFEVVMTETNELFTEEGLAQFEIVFFNNTSGDVLNAAEEQAYEKWMTGHDGAFAGVHAATDTENAWTFYLEVIGQFYDGHGYANVIDDILLEAAALNHPALKGVPNPWQRAEEWMQFKSHQQWTAKPGFRVLGRKAADGQPITWVREFAHFRSFYTGLGHDPSVFKDAAVKQHITGGIMWAVRREHLIH
jgi:type 1 glutamine amidotransferase